MWPSRSGWKCLAEGCCRTANRVACAAQHLILCCLAIIGLTAKKTCCLRSLVSCCNTNMGLILAWEVISNNSVFLLLCIWSLPIFRPQEIRGYKCRSGYKKAWKAAGFFVLIPSRFQSFLWFWCTIWLLSFVLISYITSPGSDRLVF